MATATAAQPARTGPGAVHRGPPLALLGSVFVGLFLASLAVGLGMTGERHNRPHMTRPRLLAATSAPTPT
jgi:hypothetical protein